MLKKITTISLALLIFNLSFVAIASAQTKQDEKDAQRSRDAQIFVNRLGTGRESKVVVKFKDKRKSLKGYISKIDDDEFVLTDKKTSATTTVHFSDVNKIQKDKLNGFVIAGIVVGAVIGGLLICVAAGGCVE